MKQAHNCGFLIDTVHYSLSLGKVNNKSLCVCMFVYLGWLKTIPSTDAAVTSIVVDGGTLKREQSN